MSALPKQKDDDAEPILPPSSPSPSEPQIQPIVYGQNPISMKCPFCLQHIHSQIILKPECISIVLGVSLFVLVPHMVMMVLVIMLMHFTASRKHRCPLCERQLGNDGKFLVYFTDQVYSVSLLSAGFIFSKKMAVTAALLILAFLVMTVRVAKMERDAWVTTTWSQYLQQCASQPDSCFRKYRGKAFKNWQGHLLRLMDNRQNQRRYYQHALSLYLKMDPRAKIDDQPDVLLTLDSEAVFQNSELLQALSHGNLVRFNCSMHERYSGNLRDVMHFHGLEIEVIGHDDRYAMYTSEIEEDWIRLHVENVGGLRSEADEQVQKEKVEVEVKEGKDK